MRNDYDDLYQQAAAQYDLPAALLKAQGFVESSHNPNATGPKTKWGQAQGIAQLLPATARSLGVDDPYDPAQAIPAQARLMAENYKRFGNYEDALRAYHGSPNKKQWGEKTENYVTRINNLLSQGNIGMEKKKSVNVNVVPPEEMDAIRKEFAEIGQENQNSANTNNPKNNFSNYVNTNVVPPEEMEAIRKEFASLPSDEQPKPQLQPQSQQQSMQPPIAAQPNAQNYDYSQNPVDDNLNKIARAGVSAFEGVRNLKAGMENLATNYISKPLINLITPNADTSQLTQEAQDRTNFINNVNNRINNVVGEPKSPMDRAVQSTGKFAGDSMLPLSGALKVAGAGVSKLGSLAGENLLGKSLRFVGANAETAAKPTVGVITGGLAGDYSKETGANVPTQVLASVAGGLAGDATAKIAQKGYNVAKPLVSSLYDAATGGGKEALQQAEKIAPTLGESLASVKPADDIASVATKSAEQAVPASTALNKEGAFSRFGINHDELPVSVKDPLNPQIQKLKGENPRQWARDYGKIDLQMQNVAQDVASKISPVDPVELAHRVPKEKIGAGLSDLLGEAHDRFRQVASNAYEEARNLGGDTVLKQTPEDLANDISSQYFAAQKTPLPRSAGKRLTNTIKDIFAGYKDKGLEPDLNALEGVRQQLNAASRAPGQNGTMYGHIVDALDNIAEGKMQGEAFGKARDAWTQRKAYEQAKDTILNTKEDPYKFVEKVFTGNNPKKTEDTFNLLNTIAQNADEKIAQGAKEAIQQIRDHTIGEAQAHLILNPRKLAAFLDENGNLNKTYETILSEGGKLLPEGEKVRDAAILARDVLVPHSRNVPKGSSQTNAQIAEDYKTVFDVAKNHASGLLSGNPLQQAVAGKDLLSSFYKAAMGNKMSNFATKNTDPNAVYAAPSLVNGLIKASKPAIKPLIDKEQKAVQHEQNNFY